MLKKIYELMKDTKIRLIISICILFILALGTLIYFNSAGKKEITQTNNETNKTNDKSNAKATKAVYNPTAEEKKVLSKHYGDLTNDEQQVLEKLDNKYDSMSETIKEGIKTDIERLKKEKTDYNEEVKKIEEENKQMYAELIKEIEKDYPSMKINNISGQDEDKILNIDMKLLHNMTATEEEACTLSVMKETMMKEAGIKNIVIFVKDNNNKDHGILAFQLTNGEYKPNLNTLR